MGGTEDFYKKPNLADILLPLTARPSNSSKPIPVALTDIINNVIRGVDLIAQDQVPTDRQMKALQIAVEILKDSPRIAEAIGRPNSFQPTLAAQLDASSSQRQAIARLTNIYEQAQFPKPALESETGEEVENSSEPGATKAPKKAKKSK